MKVIMTCTGTAGDLVSDGKGGEMIKYTARFGTRPEAEGKVTAVLELTSAEPLLYTEKEDYPLNFDEESRILSPHDSH